MSASLWPALLAAFLGQSSSSGSGAEGGEPGVELVDRELAAWRRAWLPLHTLLAATLLGQHALYWWIGLLCFIGLSYATNPSEASFKTHLTDLSFHLHLRRLRAHELDSQATSTPPPPQSLPGDFHNKLSGSGGGAASSSASSRSASSSGGAIASQQALLAASTTSTGAGSANQAASIANGGKDASSLSHNGTSHLGQSASSSTSASASSKSNSNNAAAKVKNSQQQQGSTSSITAGNSTLNAEHKARSAQTSAHSSFGGKAGAGGGSIGALRRHAHGNGEAGRPHILSFSNRVSISLRTPSYIRTSYGLWSTVRILPAQAASTSAPSNAAAKKAPFIAGRPPLLNGVPPVTRRASTTLTQYDNKGSKKSGSSHSNSNNKKGLVSTVAHGISSTLSSPVYTPWLEQGGYFIGFLGYWWTIDDGTSYTGAREKARLNNALLAVEEQDDEDDVSVDHHASDSARAHDDIEGGHNSFDHHSHNHRPEDHATHVNGNTHSSAGSIKRKHPSKTSTGASFRGGQRRSSPTPRQTQNNNKKRGSGSTVPLHGSTQSQHTSGDVTPVTPNSAIPVDRTAGGVGGRAAGDLRDDLLSTNADRNLPGLPFHVDHHHQDTNAGGVGSAADAGAAATGGQLGGSGGGSGDQQGLRSALDRGDAEKVEGDSEGEKLSKGDGPGGISTVSHSASAPEAAEPTVSPAVALLQGQLDDLRTTSATTQARLESEIEELQNRKRDEDAVRTELKSRTKALEETKREAETERLEAEKKLINARSQKKVVEDRVTKARSELTKLEKREKETQERLDKAREERRTKLDQLREDVRQREALLAKEEEATDKLSNRVEALEKEIEERKNDLFHFRREEANAAAMAVTNRMNRAGRGVSHAHAHAHATGPHSGAAATAKRHHPVPHAHSAHPAHRHPSQHPNAAVPIAYPYINAEDAAAAAAGKNQASTVRSSSPAGTPPAGSTQMSTGPGALASATSNASVVPTGTTAQPIGSSFLEHRLQARRANAAANMPLAGTGAQPVSSSMNTSVIGNSASAANALYNRQQLNGLHSVLGGGNNEDGSPTELDSQHSAIPGSTFAPFGPASPTSPATIGGTSPREGHGLNISPPLMHAPYFASDTAGSQSRLHAARSREDFLAGIRAGRDLHDLDATRLSPGQAHTPTLMPSTDLSGNFVDEEDSYMSAKLGGKKIERRESFGSTASFTSSNGGPLSPMTPHQASLIPSHLFDMLDEVEMPTSPSPYQSSGPDDQPHHAFTQGMMDVFDPSDTAGHLSDMPEHHSQSMLDASDDLTSTTTTAEPRRTSAMYSPWADFDMDAGFDFDKPLGFGKQQQFLGGSNAVSRKSSARDAFSSQRESLLHKRSGSPLNASLDSASAALLSNNNGPSQNDPVISTVGHGHHGSVGSIGQRSNTSSSVGQVSPSLAAATATSTASNAGLPSNAFGKMSPNDLLLDKARQALSLNPDAKAFSFKRPLPSSASAGSLHSIAKANGGLPSNAVGALGGDATRQAFDAAVGGPLGNNNNNNHHTGGSGQESPILGAVSGGNATVVGAGAGAGAGAGGGGGTWASPNLGSRGLPAVSHLGYGHSAAGLRESVRSASGPPSSTAAATSGSNQGMHAGSSFSPFDDDDLLKGW